jgi:hypothetical protein
MKTVSNVRARYFRVSFLELDEAIVCRTPLTISVGRPLGGDAASSTLDRWLTVACLFELAAYPAVFVFPFKPGCLRPRR